MLNEEMKGKKMKYCIVLLTVILVLLFSTISHSSPVDLGQEKNVLAEYFRDGKGGNLLFKRCLDDRLDEKHFCTKFHPTEAIILNAPDNFEPSFDDSGIHTVTAIGHGSYSDHVKYVKNPKYGEVFEHEYIKDKNERESFNFTYRNDGTRIFIIPDNEEGPYAQTIEIFDWRTLRFMPDEIESSQSFRLVPEIKRSLSVTPNVIGDYFDKHPKVQTIYLQACLGCGNMQESCKRLSTKKHIIRREWFNAYQKPLGQNHFMEHFSWRKKPFYVAVSLDSTVMFTYGKEKDIHSQRIIGINVIQGDTAISIPEAWVCPEVENTCKNQPLLYYKISK